MPVFHLDREETMDYEDEYEYEEILEGKAGREMRYDEYDDETQAVLDVEFPTWYFSTHGLSRPSSPLEVNIDRYFSLSPLSFSLSLPPF